MHLSDVSGPTGSLLVVSGFGAARLLAGETGLHVLDYEDREESARSIARVVVKPTPPALPEAAAERQAALLGELEKCAPPSVVVRRYRLGAAPFVRDVRQGWRTGRVNLVFEGHFDLMGELWPGAVEEAHG